MRALQEKPEGYQERPARPPRRDNGPRKGGNDRRNDRPRRDKK